MAATNVQSSDGLQRAVTSPWSQIVRGGGGGELESVSPVSVATVGSDSVPVTVIATVPEHVSNASPDWSKVVPETVSSIDDPSTEGQADASKKPVWNRPSNGVVDAVSPVMGAAWPALGESTKPTLKSTSSESLKALSDGSFPPALQVTVSSSPSHKQANANGLNSPSTPNHVAPFRQRSSKRGGGNSNANASANVLVSQPPPTTHEPPHNTSGNTGNAAEQPSPREHAHKDPQKGGFGSHSHTGNDHHHHHQRGSYRRGNGGSYHHNYGGKRDQEWNQQSRSFNNRDPHLQSQRGVSRGYIRPNVHTSATFIPPPMHVPVQPFNNNMMYPGVADVTSPVLIYPGQHPVAMPFGAPQVYFTGPDPMLFANIVNQIDYYFSNENLVKDTYLRRNMDEQGWVSASLIARFNKVSFLTDNVQLILDAMRNSALVEVQGDKMRRRNDWMKWIMPATGQYSNPSSPHANHEGFISQVQGLTLHDPTSTNHVQTYLNRSSSEEFTGGEDTVGLTSQQSHFDNAASA